MISETACPVMRVECNVKLQGARLSALRFSKHGDHFPNKVSRLNRSTAALPKVVVKSSDNRGCVQHKHE